MSMYFCYCGSHQRRSKTIYLLRDIKTITASRFIIKYLKARLICINYIQLWFQSCLSLIRLINDRELYLTCYSTGSTCIPFPKYIWTKANPLNSARIWTWLRIKNRRDEFKFQPCTLHWHFSKYQVHKVVERLAAHWIRVHLYKILFFS